MQSSILCIIFQKKLAEIVSHHWTKARQTNWKVIFIFDLWDQIPLWFLTLHCAVGKKSLHRCPSRIWVLEQQLQWTGFLSPYPQLFPAPCFSKIVFQADQHNWFGDVLKPNSVNWSELQISSHSPFFPPFFAGFFIQLYHLPTASPYAAPQTGVLVYLGGMTRSENPSDHQTASSDWP